MAEEQQAAEQQAAGSTIEASEFDSLLKKEFKPKSDRAKEAVHSAVTTLAEQALQHTDLVGSDSIKAIEAMIAAIDEKLTGQVNQILHHSDFQSLEGSWRGLHHLVNNTETDEMLKGLLNGVDAPTRLERSLSAPSGGGAGASRCVSVNRQLSVDTPRLEWKPLICSLLNLGG